ncbi:MAG: serine/threonine protein kinase [Planctomycetaceae bacterium]|nr:serine/threonine protein kinase [Planctomycetaceae bacterium]
MLEKRDIYPKIILSGTDPDLPDTLPVGTARYTDFMEMTASGKSRLHSCWDQIIGRVVVMKRLLPEFADDEKERRRFLREARVTAQLQHPNTVPVYDIGRDERGDLYFTMKRIAGENLFEIMKRLARNDPETEARYPLGALLDIVRRASLALAYAHNHGVIHRDVKPENIWVGRFAEVILLDWGVAKVWGARDEFDDPTDLTRHELLKRTELPAEPLTLMGQRPGTPLYMSPEQVLGQAWIDERTDIYSMGVLLYEMLAFKEPFRGRTVGETFDRIINEMPTPPREQAPERNIPSVVENIALKAMAKNPDDRFSSIMEMVEAIREAQHNFPLVTEAS